MGAKADEAIQQIEDKKYDMDIPFWQTIYCILALLDSFFGFFLKILVKGQFRQ